MANDKVPIEITEAASDWLERLSKDSILQREREAFADWLLTSPVHVSEYLQISAMRAELTGTLKRHPEWAESLLVESEGNVVAMPRKVADKETDQPPAQSRRYWPAVAALAMVSIASWLLWSGAINPAGDPDQIVTALGEQRSVLLSDGSTIELNTESSVRIRMTLEAREITLLRGEVMFDVAKDPTRPFRVSSDDVLVEAIGTRFNVYRREADTVVTVVEGRVAVNHEAEPSSTGASSSNGITPAMLPERVELTAGLQVAVARTDPIPKPAPANLDKATAWTARRLVFDDEPLVVIVAEFNRYNRSRVIIVDDGLNTRRISGVFDANDPDEFIALLSSLESINVQRTADGHRTLARVVHNVNE